VWCGRRKRELGNERRCEDGTVRWCCVESWVVLLCVGALDVDVAPMGTGGGWQEVAAVALSRASCQARWRWRWRWRWRRRASWSYDAIDPRSAAVEAVEGLRAGKGNSAQCSTRAAAAFVCRGGVCRQAACVSSMIAARSSADADARRTVVTCGTATGAERESSGSSREGGRLGGRPVMAGH
jgi:hypothetical protein